MANDRSSAADLWRTYRDWFLIATFILGLAANYGALTTRLANDEAQTAALQMYVRESLVPRNEQTLSNSELKEQLKTMQESLDQIQNEIFQMQEKAK